MMIEAEIEIRTSDGVSDGFLYRPEGERTLPGIIHLTDIGGIRPSQHAMARRLAAEGNCVLMPNVFYRTGRPPVFNLPADRTEEQWRQRLAELTGPLTPEAMARDGVQYVDFLASQPFVSPVAFGVVGYCFTGSMAMRIAAARPDRIGAAAAFHGGGLFSDAPSSPHLVLPRIQARLYFGHAINDRSMSVEAIEKLNQALEVWGGKYESEVYEGAYHGWTVPDSPVYNQLQAERAFEKQTELFQETLK
jgi:carboxymethylenebutenolidase